MARLHRSGPMAAAVFLFVVSLMVVSTQAIQVAPNSPCASLCIDNSSLDTSDPNSSTTTNADILCYDSDFATSAAGQKWTACMVCLQNSIFSQGAESDQAWFFYNLRYNVDYCVFGYPNASDVGSNPCQTSTACGPMQGALLDGIPTMGNDTEYGYCTANGTTLTSTLFKTCVACVSGGGQQNIVANSLVALEAGCLQQLPPSEAVGLSGTVFSSATIISIVAPTQTGSTGSGAGNHRVATTTIAVIVVVALLLIAAVSGFAFVCYRKRRGSARRAAGSPRSIFRKDDGRSSAESGIGGGFVPSGAITGSALGGVTASPLTVRNSPLSASSSGPTAWSARFQSSDHITSPLSFQCRASATSLDEMVDLKTVKTDVAPPVPAIPEIPMGQGKGHSRNDSGSRVEPGAALQEQLRQQQVPSASRKKHQKPQTISSAAKNSTNNNSNGASGLAIGGLGNASNGHLPAIVESPFPSPAPVAGVPDSIGLRIHSSDFDKKGYVEAAVQLPQKHSQPLSPPRLYQLKTSFSPQMGSSDSTSPSALGTPTSSTALLGSTSLAGHQPQTQQTQATTPVYNPAAYSPVSYHPGSLYAQSQRGSIGYQPAYGGGHHASSAATSLMREPASASSYTAPTSGPSPIVYNANAAVNAAAANKRGVYQGWSAMVTAAQQYQQQQLQMQKQQGTSSLPASAVSVASMASISSSNGLGSATMAVRQSFSAAGDVSATSQHTPNNVFPPGHAAASTGGSAAAVRPLHNKSPHTKSRTSMISQSPHSTRSPQHTQSELVRTDFLPPPPAKTRR